VHLEFFRDVGRLPSGGDEATPAEGSGPTTVTTIPRCAPADHPTLSGVDSGRLHRSF